MTRKHRQEAGLRDALPLKHLEVWLQTRLAQYQWDAAWDAAQASTDLDAIDRLGDGPAYATSLALLSELFASSDSYPGRALAMLQFSYVLRETGSYDESLAIARALACPAAAEWTPKSYGQCTPLTLPKKQQALLWMQLIGEAHFESPGALPLAVAAYQRAVQVGGDRSAIAKYKLAWSHYRQDNYAEAIASFVELLNVQHRSTSILHQEARVYIAISLMDQWEMKKTSPKRRAFVEHVETALSKKEMQSHRTAILEAVLQVTRDMAREQEANDIERLLKRSRSNASD